MYKAGKHAADTAHTLLLQTVNMTEAYINSIGNCLRRPVLQVHSLQHLLLLQRRRSIACATFSQSRCCSVTSLGDASSDGRASLKVKPLDSSLSR